MAERMVTLERNTNETQIELTLDLDGVVHVGRHLGELVIGQCDLCVLGDAAHVFLAECHRRSLPHNR